VGLVTLVTIITLAGELRRFCWKGRAQHSKHCQRKCRHDQHYHSRWAAQQTPGRSQCARIAEWDEGHSTSSTVSNAAGYRGTITRARVPQQDSSTGL
jgi:hypothetical protein